MPRHLDQDKESAIRKLVPLLSRLKARTFENYETVWRQYCAVCAARLPPLDPLPIGVKNAGGFLLWRWLTPKQSGQPYVMHMKATSGILTRLRHFAREQDSDVRTGGMRTRVDEF